MLESQQELGEQNAALSAQNAALAAQVADLTALLGGRTAPPKGIVASVLARPPVAPYDVLIVDQGASAGVRQGAQAYGAGGTPIGVVGEVEGSRSRVTLYSARTMKTDGWAGADRIPLTIDGIGAGAFRATVSKDAGVAVGDGVYVAHDGAFPVGTVHEHRAGPVLADRRARRAAVREPVLPHLGDDIVPIAMRVPPYAKAATVGLAALSLFWLPWPFSLALAFLAGLVLPPPCLPSRLPRDLLYYPGHGMPWGVLAGAILALICAAVRHFVKTRIM